MRTSRLALAAAALATAASLVAVPASAAQAAAAPASHAVLTDRGDPRPEFSRFSRGRRFPFHFGGRRFASPFLFGFPGHGFRSHRFFDDRACEVFLEIGDIQGYVLCRVG